MSSPATRTRKSAIVTGGASGIGLAMSRHFASQGHRVAILDVDTNSGPQIAAYVAAEYPYSTVSFKKCDVTSWDEQAAVFKEVYEEHGGRLEIVMANAGVSEQGATTAVHLDEDSPSPPRLTVLNINLIGTIYTVKLALHYMSKNKPGEAPGSKGGSIICTASNAGLYPFPVAPLYGVSKAGVINLVQSLPKLISKSNIRINALAPAVLDTNIAPDKSLFANMVVTPMSTLIRGVSEFIDNPSVTGAVAEIHGDNVTIRPPHEYVDEDTEKNMNEFWRLGYA
ncbi:hypothetical protein B0H66DRAFT_567447 [Apodospora peruviana]|uniref:Uncharacterized protein n=1 Tax=Apodospora peruviana TaxID=516989 RepID=A0AAE0LZX2_9PEZI|nr:hypothetical protein B0H66DRAFT_567447 [Apodospora peruviana]